MPAATLHHRLTRMSQKAMPQACCWRVSGLMGTLWGGPAGRQRLMRALRPAQGGLLWRTAKADVAHELGLPGQSARMTHLTLSAIERHFYMTQHKARPPASAPQSLPLASFLPTCCHPWSLLLAHRDLVDGHGPTSLTYIEALKVISAQLRIVEAGLAH